MLTVDIASLTAIAEAGVTQPVVSDLINANIPAQFRDPEGNWIGLTSRARVAYVSNERVAAGEITTFEDLADPRWQGRICTRSGLHSYNVAMVAAFLAHNGEEATLAWLEGLKANLARSPQGNDRAQVKAIWAGECDVALGNTYYMGKMLEDPEQTEWANSTNIVFPIMGGSGAHVNVSGMAMTASAPNRDDALALMEFLTSQIPAQPRGQPKRTGAKLGQLHAGCDFADRGCRQARRCRAADRTGQFRRIGLQGKLAGGPGETLARCFLAWQIFAAQRRAEC